jgi:hypothetical protein
MATRSKLLDDTNLSYERTAGWQRLPRKAGTYLMLRYEGCTIVARPAKYKEKNLWGGYFKESEREKHRLII